MPPALAPLPIDEVLGVLADALRAHPCVVLRAPTGAGKTTRVPPAVLDLALGGAGLGGTVLMLEPRRLAARAAARRIAAERGSAVGEEVGYHVRFDRQAGPLTRIEIVTDGILVRRLQEDPYLEGIGAVVFDEFHERSLAGDLALGMARRIQQTVRPELKIVVMSATLAPEPIAAYLGGCPIVESQGRLFPVETQYARHAERGGLPERAAAGVQQILERTPGDILVFLPGVGEIRKTATLLGPLAAERQLAVMQLYGDLPAEQQDAVLRHGPLRKVVLATNVAETSVTIEGITGVVDTGQARILKFDRGLGLDRLQLSRVSRAAAEQRSGRAGRTAPGYCLRLWTEREQVGLAEHDEPEIRRVDVAGAALELLCWGEQDVAQFPWFEPPPQSVVDHALELLADLGAVAGREPTEVGRALARLPVHPRLGKLLLEGQSWGQARRGALAAALLSERDPFLRADDTRRPQRPSFTSESDLLERVRALEEFAQTGRRDSELGSLNPGAARGVLQARDQLARLLRQTGGGAVRDGVSADEALLRGALAAFPDRVARRREPGSRRGVMVGGRGVRLWEGSAVSEAELFVCVALDAGKGESLVTQASALRREWLPAEQLLTRQTIEFDPVAERVVALRQSCWRDLVLSEARGAPEASSETSRVLAEAASTKLDAALPLDDPAVSGFLARVRFLREWLPELELPNFDDDYFRRILPDLCDGCLSFADLRRMPLLQALKNALTPLQLQALEREAPERWQVPSGNRIGLVYEPGRPPVLAVRIQEMFGLAETPRVARGRVPVLLHLLGPNYRPQQITDDLRSFWNNTYPQVRKDLRRRYPKHDWPEDPWNAVPRQRPPRRGTSG